jgi:hypothetical protein
VTTIPSRSPDPQTGASSDGPATPAPLVVDEASVALIRLDYALGGAVSDPVEFLATVEFASGLTIGPVKVVLAEPTRIAIEWPDRLIGSDGAGVAREIRLSPEARQQIHDALVRHVVFGDLGRERP